MLHSARIARSRRIKEVAQRLANAREPDAVWNAYARFWQKAANDYAHEYGITAKLTGDISFGMTAAHRTIEDAVAGAQKTPSKLLRFRTETLARKSNVQARPDCHRSHAVELGCSVTGLADHEH